MEEDQQNPEADVSGRPAKEVRRPCQGASAATVAPRQEEVLPAVTAAEGVRDHCQVRRHPSWAGAPEYHEGNLPQVQDSSGHG